MAKLCTGEASKLYEEQAAACRKEAVYSTGKEFRKLTDVTMEARRSPRFARQIESFLKKYPEGYYAGEARKMLEEAARTGNDSR